MERPVFGVDEIHALRVEMAERRNKMPPEDAQREFRERVERGRRAIADARSTKCHIDN